MTRRQEKWYPLTGGIIAGAAFYFGQRHFGWLVPNTMPSLFSSVINVCAIAIGFLGTAQSILVSMEGKDVINQLRQSGTLEKIVAYVIRGILWSFWLAATSAIFMLADWSTPANAPATQPAVARAVGVWFIPLLSLWILLLVTATLAYYRIISVFAKILQIGAAPNP